MRNLEGGAQQPVLKKPSNACSSLKNTIFKPSFKCQHNPSGFLYEDVKIPSRLAKGSESPLPPSWHSSPALYLGLIDVHTGQLVNATIQIAPVGAKINMKLS